MRKTILLALALTFALALGASANMLTAPTWTAGTTESFTAYDPVLPGLPDPESISYIGKLLGQGTSNAGQKNCSNDPWDNWQLAQVRGQKLGTDNAVRFDVSSTSRSLRATYRSMDGTSPTESFNRVSLRIKSNMTASSDYTAGIHASNNAVLAHGSNSVPLWDVSNLSVRPHVGTAWDTPAGPEWIGADVAYADNLWHWLDVAYSLTTGEAEWYIDGALVGTMALDPALQAYFTGRNAENIELWQKNPPGLQAGGSDGGVHGIWVDDITFYSATVPEPSSLMALGTLGVGLLGLIRRRRA